jgi:N5-(carboxyethyl)ornithine synthase
MKSRTLGVIGTSLKENERRVPIHPAHISLISSQVRRNLIFETGYGCQFGVSDSAIAAQPQGFASREEILRTADIILLSKPTLRDYRAVRENSIVCGWHHCVQGYEVTQIAIERRLTLLAWEAMFRWLDGDVRDTHVFHKNNELAGFCGVIHALALLGVDGHYGPSRKAVVLSFGSVSRGAIYALQGRGYRDITVYTQRPTHLVRDQIYGCEFRQMEGPADPTSPVVAVDPSGVRRPLIEILTEADVIVNGILQDTDNPLMYFADGEHDRLLPGCLIIDVSCDAGMGFSFARPTTFEDPISKFGHVQYYGVDHTAAYLWNSASWEISLALLPYLETITQGPEGWSSEPTVSHAIEIAEGVVQNPRILRFQKRSPAYPHDIMSR